MLQKLTILSAIAGLMLLAACGTNKKLQAAQTEIDQLKTQNSQLTSNVNDLTNTVNGLKKQVSDLTSANSSMTSEYAAYKTSCQETERKYHALRDMLQEQYNTLQKVEAKIVDAMIDFQNKGVEVYYQKGLVYVSLEESLLYKTGSAALGEKGKKALASLASVLNDYPKLKVIVLGNTDNAKFKGGSDNWSLSTERANGVVRILEHEYKVEPSRLTAAGKGKYNPVADNGTADGRARNRRTDIILNPDMERIWESVQDK
ncbi:MAG TPA: OmpA family protein [Puia sp.]|nr:OmpA family protein [Puia sp.]